jgi:hypothetical protein
VAPSLGLEAQLLDVRKSEDIVRAFHAANARRTDAIVVGNDAVILANRRQVVAGTNFSCSRNLPFFRHAFYDNYQVGRQDGRRVTTSSSKINNCAPMGLAPHTAQPCSYVDRLA